MFPRRLSNVFRASNNISAYYLSIQQFSGKTWRKIDPHVHTSEIEGDDMTTCKDRDYTTEELNELYQTKGIYPELGICRTSLDRYNKELGSDKYDIMIVSTNTSAWGAGTNGNPLVYAPRDYSGLSFQGVSGVEVQNDRCDNPFGVLGPYDKSEDPSVSPRRHEKGIQLHTVTIGKDDNKLSFIVHPDYYDTVSLVYKFFKKNENYVDGNKDSEKPLIRLKEPFEQKDWNEIDVKWLRANYVYLQDNDPIDLVWNAVKDCLSDQNSYLKDLNICGLEVYNGFQAGEWSGKYLDDMLIKGFDYLAFAGNDAYYYQGEETDSYDEMEDSRLVPLGCIYGLIDNKLYDNNNYDSIETGLVNCIKNREFYASSGVKLHDDNTTSMDSIVKREGNTFYLKSIKPQLWRAIQYNKGEKEERRTRWSRPISKTFKYTIDDNDNWSYVRFEARDRGFLNYHHHAWLQPIHNK